jgi:hypothetical protein
MLISSSSAKQLWPALPVGAEAGLQLESDALPRVTHTVDNVDLNRIWDEVQAVVSKWNETRSALSSLLSFWHTHSSDAIPQSSALHRFEVATELGEPEALRPPSEYLKLGYDFIDRDAASRWSWKALRDMTSEQVRASLNYALESDNYTVNTTILQRILDPEQGENENMTPVFGLYSGTDGIKPPTYLGKRFPANHTHYGVSGNATLDSGDVELLIKNVVEHGFGLDPGAQIVLFVNPEQLDNIASWRAGEVSANGVTANHDWIPGLGAPAFYTPNPIVGQRAPAEYERLKVAGSYSVAWIIALDDVPQDYVICAATYGANSPNNCLGVREHINPTYRGFRVIPGQIPSYPIQDAFYTRAFGVGVRRRGQASVLQIKAIVEGQPETAVYDVPDLWNR